jgi:Gas vesicle protein
MPMAGGVSPSGLVDVIDTILDKGLVIDAYIRVSLIPGPGDAAADAGRERVPGQAGVVLRSRPGLLEADRLDVGETAAEQSCLGNQDVADPGRQGCRGAGPDQVRRRSGSTGLRTGFTLRG